MHPTQETAHGAHDILHYVLALRRWLPWILLIALLAGAVMTGRALLQDERYETRAAVIVSQPPDLDFSFVERPLSATAERRIENEIELLTSASIRDAVVDAGGPSISVGATGKGQSDVIIVQTGGADPEKITDDLNAFLDTYIDVRRQQTLDEFEAAANRIRTEQRELAERLIVLTAPINDLDTRIAATPPGEAQAALVLERDDLEFETSDQRSNLRSQIAEYDDFLVQVAGAIDQTDGGLEVITPASTPRDPVSPTPKRDGVLGLSAGLLIGLLLMVVVDYADDRIRNADDVSRALADLPLFGQIPHVPSLTTDVMLGPDADADTDADTDAVDDPERDLARVAGGEAYRSLATSLEFANLDEAPHILQVTSPIAGEGKSTTVVNLAIAFAATGIRVAIVDADLRRPSIHDYFGIPNDHGLSSHVAGHSTLDEATTTRDHPAEITIMPAGPIPPDPAKVLHAAATEKVLDALRQSHDLVIIDTPPILPVADGLIMAQLSDLIVLVARVRNTRRRALRKTRDAITNVDGPPIALVLNDHPLGGPGSDDYYGTYVSSGATSTRENADEMSRRTPFRGRRRRRADLATARPDTDEAVNAEG